MRGILLFFLLTLRVSVAVANVNVYTENKCAITVASVQPQFVIQLNSNPTTGYRWFLQQFAHDLVQPLQHKFIAATDKKLIGAPGVERWTFAVLPAAFVVPQQIILSFVYARPFEIAPPAKKIICRVSTSGEEVHAAA